ncbi:MAG TPA: zinc-binding dehydrogenase [Lactovum miscens]|uniref:zinc-binding dehydrogenase n=1 Tax=Lactovum miscens TaxID=190387 RepID=UPI002EDB1D6B
MKAVVKTKEGYDNMALMEVEEPQVYGDRIKIRTAYTGICGSDIHTFKGEYNSKNLPVTLGHEFSGIVAEVGPDVKKFKVGDRVTSETTFETCGKCIYCLRHDYNLCPNRQGIGTQVNGSMAEYVLSREESCHLVPDHVSLKAAAMSEPLACAIHPAIEKANVQSSDVVLIIGPGPVGLLLLQVVKALGAKAIVVGITKDLPRLNLAKDLGADIIVNSMEENLSELVLSETNGNGVDIAFDCSGAVVAVNQALPLVIKGGKFVQVGLFAEKSNSIDEDSIIQREIQYMGSRSQKPSTWEIVMDFWDKDKINSEKMITKEVDLEHWRDAFEAVMGGNEIKVLIASTPEV